MPVYQVELPDGRTVGFEGEQPPNEKDYNELVASLAEPAAGPKTNQGTVGDIEALLVGGGLNLPSAAAGLVGMGFGATRTPGGAIPKLAGALIGGLVAGGATRFAQSKVEDAAAPKLAELERQLAAEHPKSTLAGQLMTSGFGVGKLAPTILGNIRQRLAPAALGAGIEAGKEVFANKDQPGLLGEGAAKRIAMAGGEMALLNKETNLGAKFMGLGSKLASATTRQTLAGASAAANDIAMTPDQPMNVGAPQDLTGPVRNLSDFKPTQVKPPLDFGDAQLPLSLEEQAFIDQNTRARKTPKDTDVQKQIEADLGIGQKKGITESQIEYNSRIKEEAKVRNEIEQAQKAAQDEINKNLGVDQPKGRAQVDPANQTVLSDKLFNEAAAPTGKPDSETGPTLNELAGQQVEWNGKKGTLIQDNDLTWQVMPDVQKPGGPVVVHDITGAKGNDIPAKDVKVVPKGGISQAGEGGLIVNPFRMKTPPTALAYMVNPDGTFDVNWTAARRKEPNGGHKLEDLLKNGGSHVGLNPNEVIEMFGPKIGGDIVYDRGSLAEEQGGQAGWRLLEPKTIDFHSKFGSGGAVNQALVKFIALNGGGAAGGATLGYQIGDTPEEKRRNAILGGLIGLGGVSAARAALAMGPRSKSILDQIKALSVDSNPPPTKLEQLTNSNALQKPSPAKVPVDSQPGTSSEVRSPLQEGSEAPRARKPIAQKKGESPEDYRTRLLAGLEKIQNRVEKSPSVDVLAKKAIADHLASVDVEKATPAELEAAHNDALAMEQEGRADVKARAEEVKADIEQKTEELKSSVSAKIDEKDPKFVTVDRNLAERTLDAGVNARNAVKNAVKKVDGDTANRDTRLNEMDGYQGFRGAMTRVFGGTLDNAYVYRENLKDEFKSLINQVLLKPGLVNKIKNKLGFGELPPNSLKRINIYAIDRMNKANPDLVNSHLEDTLGPDFQEVADNIKLTPEEQDFYNAARETLDNTSGPAVREAMRNNFNIEVGQIQDYWPLQVVERAPVRKIKDVGDVGEVEGMDELVDALRGNLMGQNTTKPNVGQTIERQVGASGKVNLESNLLDRHLNNAAHLISHAGELQKLGKIARQPWFREKYGDGGQKYILNLLDSVARDGDPANAGRIPIADKITRNYAVGILALRLFSQLKHASNIAIAAKELGPTYLMKGLVDANTAEGQAFLKKHFPEAFNRSGGEGTIQELLEGGRLGKAQAAAFLPERILDKQIAAASSLAAYTEELQKAGKDVSNYLNEPIDVEARNQALIKARKIVTSSLKKDAPQAISRATLTGGNTSLSKAIFQFQQTALRQLHYAKTEILDEGFKKGNYAEATAAVAAVVASLAIETGMGLASKATLGAPDKNAHKESLAEHMAIEAVRKVPGVAPLIAATGHGDTGVPIVDVTTHGLHTLGEVSSGTNQFQAPLKGKSLRKAKYDLAGFVGTLAGVPGAQTISSYLKNNP